MTGLTDDARPRVLILDRRTDLYGAEHSLVLLAQHLTKVRPIVGLPRPGPYADALRDAGIEVVWHGIDGTLDRSVTHAARVAARQALTQLVAATGPDLLHLNKVLGQHAAARRAAALAGIPLLVHVRNQAPLPAANYRMLATGDAIVAVSDAVRRRLLEQAPSPRLASRIAPRINVVHNGRDLDQLGFSVTRRRHWRERLGIASDAVVVALIGYFSPVKGQDRFVELAARLHARFPHMRFLLVGAIVDREHAIWRDAVLARAAALGLRSVLTAPGWLPAGEMLSAVDIVVSLSRSEGLPGLLIEAMATRRAIVATAVGGSPEVIGPPTCGRLITWDATTDDALAPFVAAVTELAGNPSLRRQLGQAARERAEGLFWPEQVAQTTEAIYARLLARRRASATAPRVATAPISAPAV